MKDIRNKITELSETTFDQLIHTIAYSLYMKDSLGKMNADLVKDTLIVFRECDRRLKSLKEPTND